MIEHKACIYKVELKESKYSNDKGVLYTLGEIKMGEKGMLKQGCLKNEEELFIKLLRKKMELGNSEKPFINSS